MTIPPGPGNRHRRLLAATAGDRWALRYDHAVAIRVHELRDAGLTFREVGARLEAEGIRTFRGRPWSVSRLSQLCRQHLRGPRDGSTDDRRRD